MENLKTLWIRDQEQITADYLEFLRFSSVGADPECEAETRACGDWVAQHLKKSGFEVEVWETPEHPTIFGQNLQAGKDKPTVLLYGHYDVQPVDPLEEWTSPPFEPRLEGQTVYARGAQDNKGQLMYVLAALRAIETLPVNVKVCVEGDEETGSTGLEAILPGVADRLSADYLVVTDSSIPGRNQPSISLGARGVAALSLELRGSKIDLHSGLFGGIAPNPNHALVAMLSSLHGADGRVQVPGFYDAVRELSAAERSALSLEYDSDASRRDFGVEPCGGEADYPPGESGATRPTLEINGISGGYAGPGFKTVIPAVARAKISCRLVPNQDPSIVAKQVVDFLKGQVPKGIHAAFEDHHGGHASWASPDSKGMQAMAEAYTEIFGKSCTLMLMGGSIPITAKLAQAAGAEPIICGVGLPTDDIHAPDEHFDLGRMEQGFSIISRFLGGISCSST